jgi:hypothetical protein
MWTEESLSWAWSITQSQRKCSRLCVASLAYVSHKYFLIPKRWGHKVYLAGVRPWFPSLANMLACMYSCKHVLLHAQNTYYHHQINTKTK